MFNKVMVIGAGGTGSMLLPALARFLRNVNFEGDLVIVDGDNYSSKNLDRQLFGANFTETNKAEYQATVIVSHLPDWENHVKYLDMYLDEKNINDPNIIGDGTLVINCVDNRACRAFVERRLLSDNIKMMGHICCGNEDRTGQVQFSFKKNGEMITPSIFERYPDLNSIEDDISGLSCLELAALPGGGQIIGANMMAASIALNYVIQLFDERFPCQKGTHIPHAMVEFDVLTNGFGSHQKSKSLMGLLHASIE